MQYGDRSVQGMSFSPSRACLYRVPEHWVIHGRTTKTKGSGITSTPPEEKARAARARVIGRYWTAIGYLWLRTRKSKVALSNNRVINFRQGFLTLTIPGVATADHKAIKRKVLDPFFTYARNVLGLRDYVWTAEIQPSTGEIHFHCLINQFLDKGKIRRAWNDACERSGVITMSKGNKPSTEIEAVKSYNGSKAYAAKYLGKALKSGEIVGRLWSGSHSVTGFGSITTNEAEDTATMEKISAELKENGHQWISFDRDVHMTRIETIRVTRKRYPTLHRLLNLQIRTYDEARAQAVRGSQGMDDHRGDAPRGGMAQNPTASHHAGGVPIPWRGDRVTSKPGIMLQAEGVGAEQGSVGDQSTHVPRGKPWRLRSSAGRWTTSGERAGSTSVQQSVEEDNSVPF